MTNVKNNFECYAIDSCKIRIKKSQFKVINSDILDEKSKIIISNSTGEIISEEQIKSYSTEIKFDDYKIKIALVSYYNFKAKMQDEFLEIYLHSKILESDYFNGITIENLKVVYEKLIAEKVVFFSYEDFIFSSCNDIDIKFDFNADEECFKASVEELSKMALESVKMEIGVKKWKNGNLTFNRRESSTLGHPFVKLYNKELECKEKNADFFKKHTSQEEYINRRRLEVTIKKSADIKKTFDLTHSNLMQICSVTQEQFADYVGRAVRKNLTITDKVEKSLNKNNNLETCIHYVFTDGMKNKGYSFYQILPQFLSHFSDDKQNKYRIKKLCLNWFENQKEDKEDYSEEVQNIFNLLGVK